MMAPPLSMALREATREVHREVESLPLIQAIFAGTIERGTFVRYTGHLFSIYEALENGLERHREHPVCGGLLLPGLARAPRLQADLTALGGTALDSSLAGRIRELADTFPPGLVAYFYLRYFGDLSGGQMLREKLLPLSPSSEGPGLSFYDFSELGPVGPVKENLRGKLDALVLELADRQAVIDEAVRGFQEHTRLFHSLL